MTKAGAAHVAVPVLGAAVGLRSFTPLAVLAWFAYREVLPVKKTWASWLAHPATVGATTLAAVGEYVGDKLPGTPDRTAPVGLAGRLMLGGLTGALVATALKRPIVGGVALGIAGAAAGTYGGYYLRKGLVKGAGAPDLSVALSGDAAAIALSVRSLQRLLS